MIRRYFLAAQRNALRLSGSLALFFSLAAGAAIHQKLDSPLPENAPDVSVPAWLGGPDLSDALGQYGIARGSTKARIVASWLEQVEQDPAIARRIPGGVHGLEQVFLDEAKREALMSSGLARLTPTERLTYVKLFAHLLDELVPVNCFGLVDINAVMNQITLAQMSDADAELYLRLIYKVLASSASDAPVRLPTRQQYSAAVDTLSSEVVVELDADPVDLDRYLSYTTHPEVLTPSDVCWTTRVTLHALERMPETERDFILMPAIVDSDAASLASPDGTNPAMAPIPSRGAPAGPATP
ncbi:hypothetical protein [Paraburkholderia sacchari]|uniref:hypothetical protein n=1 Tax=Paraburkholderia sacchari TaxID=159450 RepID=UPI001BD16CD6|nr:hypothetical protein [Paraburkholderia sacchari]